MQDLNDKLDGGFITAAEWNQQPSELQNVIEGVGQLLNGGDLDQLGKGIAHYVANGKFGADSGVANAYVITQVGSKQSPTVYEDGQEVVFRAVNANTGASTINAFALGVVNIFNNGSALVAGDILAGQLVHLIYNASGARFDMVSDGLKEGLGTLTPGVAIAGTYNYAASDSVYEIKSTAGVAALALSGLAAGLDLIDTDNTINYKWSRIAKVGNLLKIIAFNDNGTARLDNLIVLDTSTGDLGIGISSAKGKTHIYKNASGAASVSANGNLLVLEDAISNGLTILTPDASTSLIMLGSASLNRGSEISWQHSANEMKMGTRKAGAELILMSGNAVEAIRVTSSQKVGISTSFADSKLHVYDGASGAAANVKNGLTVESNGDTYVTFQNPGANEGGLLWSNPTTPNEGRLIYNHSGKYMSMYVNNAEVIHANINGHVGIKNASPSDLITASAYPAASTVVNLKSTVGSYLALQGEAAAVDLVDTGFTVNEKWFRIVNDWGMVNFMALNDAGTVKYDSMLSLSLITGKVGVGIDSADSKLHVFEGSYGGSANTLPGITLERNGSTYVTFLTPSNAQGGLQWDDELGTARGLFVYSHLNNSMQAYTNGSLALTVTSAQRLGVNTSSPDSRIHLYDGASGAAANIQPGMTIENNSNIYITFQTPDTSASGLLFSDATSANIAQIIYDHNGPYFRFYAESAEILRLSSTRVQLVLDTLNIATQKTVSTASDTGVKGDICHDTNYIYVCTATNTWKRAALATW